MTARGVKAEEVVAFVAGYIDVHGYSPTVAEIADGTGLKSTHTAWKHLVALRSAGQVTWVPGQARTLRLSPPSGSLSQTAAHSIPTATPEIPTRSTSERAEAFPRMGSENRGELTTPPVWPSPSHAKEPDMSNVPASAEGVQP